VRHVGVYVFRSGRWWLPVVIGLWLVAAALAGAAHVVVPTSLYTIF
jgi:hypothetical protein